MKSGPQFLAAVKVIRAAKNGGANAFHTGVAKPGKSNRKGVRPPWVST